MIIKKFKTNSDNEIINWWKDWGLKIPDQECLPKKGYVIINKNIKVAAGYLYYTNAKIAYVDFVISRFSSNSSFESDNRGGCDFSSFPIGSPQLFLPN